MSAAVPVSVEALGVRYGKRPVLEDVSFEVPRGTVFALLGRNGAGKSSLVRCLLGLQKPAGGMARLFGADAWRTRCGAMQRVGVVPEDPDAPPEMTARELLAFCRALYRRWDDVGARTRLERLEVPLDVKFNRLSKGQKGAVMLALSLAPAPELLVFDDPTLGLDVVARRMLYDELIGELADRGTTVFVTTHDLTGIEAIAERVAILHDGHLVLHEALDSAKGRFRRLRCAGSENGFSWAPFEVARSLEREWGREAVVTNFDDERLEQFQTRLGRTDVEVGTLSLEDIFLVLAGAPGGVA